MQTTTKISIRILSLILLLALSACERKPDLASLKQYQEHDINFNYPGNWEITEDGYNGSVHYLIITSTGDAVVMIHTFDTAVAPELKPFTESLSTGISKEMPFGEMKTESMTFMKETGKATWIKEKLSVTLLGQTLPHIREYRKAENSKRTAFLTSQTTTEDQTTVKPGFELIIQSFELEK